MDVGEVEEGNPAEFILVIVLVFVLYDVNYEPLACSLAYKIIHITQVRSIFFNWSVCIKIYLITSVILS